MVDANVWIIRFMCSLGGPSNCALSRLQLSERCVFNEPLQTMHSNRSSTHGLHSPCPKSPDKPHITIWVQIMSFWAAELVACWISTILSSVFQVIIRFCIISRKNVLSTYGLTPDANVLRPVSIVWSASPAVFIEPKRQIRLSAPATGFSLDSWPVFEHEFQLCSKTDNATGQPQFCQIIFH